MNTAITKVRVLPLVVVGWVGFVAQPFAMSPALGGAQDLPHMTVVVELQTDEDFPVSFVEIGALVGDGAGGVFVLDRRMREIHHVSATADRASTVAGPGMDRGRSFSPCCLRVEGDSVLWVASPTQGRFDAFVREGDGFVFQRGMRIPGQPGAPLVGDIGAGEPLVVRRAASGAVEIGFSEVMPQAGQADERGRTPVERSTTFVGMDGEVIERGWYPNERVEAPYHRTTFEALPTRTHDVLFAPSTDVARDREGNFAYLYSTHHYEVVLFDPLGNERGVIRRDIGPVPLSPDDRAAAERQLATMRAEFARIGGEVAAGTVPDSKPIIRGIWFDAQGRLWVQRSVESESDPHSADVYSNDGSPLFTVEWPKSIRLFGAATGDSEGWGVFRGAPGTQHLVRFRLVAGG